MDRIRRIAHRGASDVAPENTLAAVRSALVRDCDLVEIDVQRSRDGALVVLHDASLVRTTDVRTVFPGRAPWRVADFTWRELQELDAGSWFSGSFAGERIPSLREVVDLLHGSRSGLLLEVKNPLLHPGLARDVAAELGSLATTRAEARHGRLVVQSFDEASVRTFHDLLPTVPVGLLGSPSATALGRIAGWATHVNPSHRRLDQRYVDEVHRHGLQCLPWTVDRRAALRRVVRLGVDGVITNRLDALADVVDRQQALAVPESRHAPPARNPGPARDRGVLTLRRR